VDDVARLVRRPVLSISTNGTLITEEWAERLVRTPFSSVTVSIDGGTRATYNRIRKGADLDGVLANIDRIRRYKDKLGSNLPYLDSFFVVMRSNFREIPQYLELMQGHGMIDVALQTMELCAENTARHPSLAAEEALTDPREIAELHAIMRECVPRFRKTFRMVRVSGLATLFGAQGLDAAFLEEGERSLYPDSDGLADGGFELCPNPWTTLFAAENGDVHLCFISQPIGSLYTEPLAALWNSAAAIAKRADMIAGRYLASGCARWYCDWREGQTSARPDDAAERSEWHALVRALPDAGETGASRTLDVVRGLVAAEHRKTGELEAGRRALEAQLEAGRKHIHHLEGEARQLGSLLDTGQRHIDHLEAKTEKAIADFRHLEAEFAAYRASWLVRAARKASRILNRKH
jgi:MoaA/NifB/PqqE/SkfB family radical SAM enzyme